jgi:hypothetical protein
MKRQLCWIGISTFVIATAVGHLTASAPSGAIFTTLPDGSRVNFNIYASKPDVYLDGGPGDQAPQGAAGLDDGTYVFQVTDPSGKVLLSIDPARCREVIVANGIITGVVQAGGCEHATGVDQDHGAQGAKTVQLCGGGAADPANPTACFSDTPNPGGEYKAWITLEADFLDGCALLGTPNGLDVVDCGAKTKGNAHGFVPRHSKTDNFKVGGSPREIDTRFFAWDGTLLDGLQITWTDTLGASNDKWSYLDLALQVNHEAHVEDVEDGTHSITITNQPGCTVGAVYVDGSRQSKSGPQTVSVHVAQGMKGDTIFVDVHCQ